MLNKPKYPMSPSDPGAALPTPPTPASTSAAPQTAPAAHPGLATLLSRLAALQGRAMPAFRFAYMEQGRSGVDIAILSLAEQAIELWTTCFPEGQVRALAPASAERSDFPALWLGNEGERTLLVRGRLSSGHLITEDAQGVTAELEPAKAAQGRLIGLTVSAQAEDLRQRPQTATDWFAYAMRRHRRIFFEGVFATFMISAIGLAGSLYTMQVYDRVVPTGGYATLWVLTAGVLMAVLLELGMKLVRAHMVDRASKAIDLELSGVFFAKALSIRMDARPNTVGTFASQIRHFESVRNFIASSTLFVLADAPFALFFIGVIALIAGPVAIVPAVAVPIAILSGFMFRGAIERYTAENMNESNRKNGLLIESLDGIESIKASAGEWKMMDRHTQLTEAIARTDLKLKDVSSRSTNIAQTIQQLNYVGMIAVGAYAISTGSLSMGGLIASSIIAGRALAPIAQIPMLVVQWKHAKIALGALDGIMQMPSDRDDSQRLIVPEQCSGHLRLEKVSYAYRENKPALQVEGLEFRPGERVALVGPVGSGKSTLIKVLSGLHKPQTGTVFLDGVDIMNLAPEFVREHVGYLPQDVRLFQGTLRENLTIGLPTPNDSVIMHAAALTGLDAAIRHHPKGLELQIAEGGSGLSGGQRQLVGLTRLLIARPRVLLLDEPTASMDNQLEARAMRHLFNEMPKDSLVVVVTHKLSVLSHVDRVVVVDRGQITMDGPRDSVMARLQQRSPGAPVSTALPKGVPA